MTDAKQPPNASGDADMEVDIVAGLSRETESQRWIGRFVFAFSQLEFTVKALLARHLGLEEGISEAVTANLDFARACEILRAVLKKKLQGDPARSARADAVIKEIMALNTDHRLTVAHGLWTPENLGLVARIADRKGGPPKYKYEQPKELENASDKADALMTALLGV
jgi:hypothetical protein